MKLLTSILCILVLTVGVAANTITLEGFGEAGPIRSISRGEIEYFSSADFFTGIGASADWSDLENALTVSFAGHQLTFRLDNPFCVIDGRAYNLVQAPVYFRDDLYLPVDQTLHVLRDVLGGSLVYDRTRNALLQVGEGLNVVGVNVEEKINGILLEILLTERLRYEVFVTEGNWVNVTLIGGSLNAERISRERPSALVRRIRAFQFDNSAQVSIQMRGKVKEYHHNLGAVPPRVQISIEDLEFTPELYDSAVDQSGRTYDPIDVIVIDPGHGGRYDGAIGRDGLKEKEVVLDIALRLEALLDRDLNFTPVLTRRADHTVELEQRALTAGSAGGDLFISIHANASTKRNASGCETYFLAGAKTDDARAAELLENSDFKLELPNPDDSRDGDLDFIVMDLLQTEYLHQSRQLAEAIQSEMENRLNIKSRGVNQAGFVVLNHVNMPSALVEVAFISNKVEEKLLAQDDFRQTVAEAIYEGVLRFATLYERENRIDARQ